MKVVHAKHVVGQTIYLGVHPDTPIDEISPADFYPALSPHDGVRAPAYPLPSLGRFSLWGDLVAISDRVPRSGRYALAWYAEIVPIPQYPSGPLCDRPGHGFRLVFESSAYPGSTYAHDFFRHPFDPEKLDPKEWTEAYIRDAIFSAVMAFGTVGLERGQNISRVAVQPEYSIEPFLRAHFAAKRSGANV